MAATLGSSTTATSTTFAHTVEANTTMLVVYVALFPATANVTGITWDGGAMTECTSKASTQNIGHAFYYANPTAKSANIVVTVSGVTDSRQLFGAINIKGSKTDAPAATSTNGTGPTFSSTITSAADNLVLTFSTCYNDNYGPTWGTGETEASGFLGSSLGGYGWSRAAWTPGETSAVVSGQYTDSTPNLQIYLEIDSTTNTDYSKIAWDFTQSGTIQTTQLYLVAKGINATLSGAIHADHATPGKPAAASLSTFTTSSLSDTASLVELTLSASTTLTSGGVYWLVLDLQSSAATPTYGYDTSSAALKYDTVGAAWISGGTVAEPKYYFAPTGVLSGNQKLLFVRYKGALLCITNPRNDATASLMYLNGAWGCADANTGALTTLVDGTKTGGSAWATNEWADCWAYITGGAGQGECRKIASNNGTTLTVSPAFDTTHSATTTTYVILGSDKWTDITASGTAAHLMTQAAKDAIVAGGYLYTSSSFTSSAMWHYEAYNNAGTWTTRSDEEGETTTTLATKMCNWQHPTAGMVLAWAKGGHVYYSAHKTSYADLAAGTDLGLVGNSEYAITGLCEHDGELYIGTEGGLYHCPDGTHIYRVPVGLEAYANPNNMQAMVSQDQFLYFGWSHSLERFLGPSQLDDIGPWKGAGLPQGRTGVVSCLLPVMGWLFLGIDGGSANTSSVLVYNERGYHEIFRGWDTNKRVQGMAWQAIPNGNPILWINVGGGLVYMKFPKDTLNPLHDTGMYYKSSCELITSTFDMGAASLPKFFKDITLATRNLSTTTYVGVDYQLDSDINGSTWTPAGKAWRNPEDVIKIIRGGSRRIRVRLTPTTSSATNPPVIEATVLKAFARTPYKRQFNVRIKASDYGVTRAGLMDFKASELTNFLRDAATNAKPLYMRSVFDDMDDMWVIIEPPSVFREFANLILGKWGGQIAFAIKEV